MASLFNKRNSRKEENITQTPRIYMVQQKLTFIGIR